MELRGRSKLFQLYDKEGLHGRGGIEQDGERQTRFAVGKGTPGRRKRMDKGTDAKRKGM